MLMGAVAGRRTWRARDRFLPSAFYLNLHVYLHLASVWCLSYEHRTRGFYIKGIDKFGVDQPEQDYIVPYWTVIAHVKNGVLERLEWEDDGCKSVEGYQCIDNNSGLTYEQCKQKTDGVSCDVKVGFSFFCNV